MDLNSISIELSRIDEQYSSKKNDLSETRRQLGLQPLVLSTFIGEQKQIRGSNSGDSEKNGVVNPVYTKLQVKILTYEVQLKALLSKKSRLVQKIGVLELDASTQSQIGERPEFKQKQDQIKNLENKIKKIN